MRIILWLMPLLLLVADPAEARRRNAETPAPRCFDQTSQLWVNCVTSTPVDQPETESPGVVVDTTEETTFQAVPRPLPLNLDRHTLEEFNDSRVGTLHAQVRELIAEAVNNARRPFTNGRNDSLVDEIQVRLDPLADGTDPNRPIDYYWLIYYHDRTEVFVKPMRNLHILRYSILVGS